VSTVAAAIQDWRGHNPKSPRLFEPPPALAQARIPRILREAQRRLEELYHHPELVPTFANKPQSQRLTRSERREACCALLGPILQYTDLVSLRVGRPRGDGELEGITLAELAALAGLPLRRAERAYHDLVLAGVITTHEIAVRVADGAIRARAAIRRLSEAFLEAIRLGRELAEQRRKAYRRKRRREQQGPAKGTPEHGRARLALAAARRAYEEGRLTGPDLLRRTRAALSGRDPPP